MNKLLLLSVLAVSISGCSFNYIHTVKHKHSSNPNCSIPYEKDGNKTSFVEEILIDDSVADSYKERVKEVYEMCIEKQSTNQ